MNRIVVSKLLSLIHMLLVLLYLYSYVLLPNKKKNGSILRLKDDEYMCAFHHYSKIFVTQDTDIPVWCWQGNSNGASLNAFSAMSITLFKRCSFCKKWDSNLSIRSQFKVWTRGRIIIRLVWILQINICLRNVYWIVAFHIILLKSEIFM